MDRRPRPAGGLNPAAVVTGHKDPTRGNPPSVLAESRGYLEYYGQLREAALPDRELFDAMVSRYPDWVSARSSCYSPSPASRPDNGRDGRWRSPASR
jgi:hypothetical protein